MKPGNLFVLLFIVGGIFGVLVVRGFLLDSLQEIGWRLFWGGLSNGEMMDIGMVFESATFAKCLVGFIIGGLAFGFVGINIKNMP